MTAPISARQWGFMSNRSTVSALLNIVDDWQRALDTRCVWYFFYISTAFDAVSHSLLLAKLNELGLDPYLPQWIRNYLSDRSQYVCVDGASSHCILSSPGISFGPTSFHNIQC